MVIMTVSPSNCCVCLGCFPGTSWTSACRRELVNKFLILLCFACRLHLLNWLYLDPPVFSPSVSSLCCGRGDWMRGCCLGWTHVRNWFWFPTTQPEITIRNIWFPTFPPNHHEKCRSLSYTQMLQHKYCNRLMMVTQKLFPAPKFFTMRCTVPPGKICLGPYKYI